MTDKTDDKQVKGIAIIGISCNFPGAENKEKFWKNLCNGVVSMEKFTKQQLRKSGVSHDLLNDPNYVPCGYVINDIDAFDAAFFEYPPDEAKLIDPQQRLFLQCCWKGFEDAGYVPDSIRESVGVFASTRMSSYMFGIQEKLKTIGTHDHILALMGNDKDYLSSRVSYKLNLKGPSITIQTACSSSLVAVHMACESLLNYECDMAVAGGVAVSVPLHAGYLYQEGMICSPDGLCRAFDEDAQGTAFGNGLGVVVLKRAEDAYKNGDRIYAVVKGSAVNNDGALKVGYTAPGIQGQIKVIQEAQQIASVNPETIGYAEAHGTGTPIGDSIEIEALSKTFKEHGRKQQYCAIGSVKTNIGHLEAAAGIASLIKTALSLKYKTIVPSMNFKKSNTRIDFENTPFFVNTTLRKWDSNRFPRRACVSSFGIGGTNAHAILEEALEKETEIENSIMDRPRYLFTLSAKTPTSLKGIVKKYIDILTETDDRQLGNLCHFTGTGRKDFNCRVAVNAGSVEQLQSALQAFHRGEKNQHLVSETMEKIPEPGIAFLFTGQGVEYHGMGRLLYETQPIFKETLETCADILSRYMDQPLLELMFGNKGPLIHDTRYSQPATFALEYALSKMFMGWGIQPSILMGHSVGEYVAACIAGVFSIEDALKLIAGRARLMDDVCATVKGVMYSVFADREYITQFIEKSGYNISVAAFNGPKHTVVSGEEGEVGNIVQKLEECGVGSVRLKVSGGFHSHLMTPMLEDFEKIAESIAYASPEIKVISNISGKPQTHFTSKYWIDHIRKPVDFQKGMTFLEKEKIDFFYEMGPHPVLCGMGRKCVASEKKSFTYSLKKDEDNWYGIIKNLACFYIRGGRIDWSRFDKGSKRRKMRLPTYCFDKQHLWLQNSFRDHGGQEKGSQVIGQASDVHFRGETLKNTGNGDKQNLIYNIKWLEKNACIDTSTNKVKLTDKKDCWIIFFNPGDGLGKCLVKRIHEQNRDCVCVYPGASYKKTDRYEFTINPFLAADYQRLFHDIDLSHITYSKRVVQLWGMGGGISGLSGLKEEISSRLERICSSTLLMLQALIASRCLSETGLWIITRGAHKIFEKDNGSDPLQRSLWGLGSVILREYPELLRSLIDLGLNSNADAEAEHIIGEMLSPVNETHLALRQKTTYVSRLVSAVASASFPDAPAIEFEGTYLITGGLGGLGIETAKWLALHGVKSIVLVGRNRAGKKAANAIESLRQSGVSVLEAQADVSEIDQIQELFNRINVSFPPIKGIFHLAGILDDELLGTQQWTRFKDAIAAKVFGAWHLHCLTLEMELDHFVMFSSLTSLIGNHGHGSYATANAFLDGLAAYRVDMELPALSINWGAWRDVGMAAVSNEKEIKIREDAGMKFLTVPQGFEMLYQLLQNHVTQAGVMSIEWNRFVRNMFEESKTHLFDELINNKAMPEQFKNDGATSVSDNLKQSPDDQKSTIINQEIQNHVAEVLWMDKSRPFNSQKSLMELGFDSMMIIQLRAFIKARMGADIPLRKFIENPDVSSLVEIILSQLKKKPGDSKKNPPESSLPKIEPDFKNRFKPFPLTDVQHAYWVGGRGGVFELSHVACHLFLEVDIMALDLQKLEIAFNLLIKRHDMLRAVILPDGRQQILEDVPLYKIDIYDLRGEENVTQADHFKSMYEKMSHQVLPADRAPMIDLKASLIDERRTRLHCSFDLLIGDGYSFGILIRDLSHFYTHGNLPLPELSLSFRDYVIAQENLNTHALYQQSLKYWNDKIDTLAPRPDLPLSKSPSEITYPVFVRHRKVIETDAWKRLQEKASLCGLTSSGLLLAAFAEVLQLWSRNSVFTVNLTLFNRLPLHEEVNEIVGDFTTLTMLSIDTSTGVSFKSRARIIQEQLWKDLEHRYVSGITVLREIFQKNKGRTINIPIVFTSALPYTSSGTETSLLGGLPRDLEIEFVNSISQTPQVWLDNQVSEIKGQLIINWDIVKGLFPADLIEDMFKAYTDLLCKLADDDTIWNDFDLQLLPEKQQRKRDEINCTHAAVSGETLHGLFEAQVGLNPDHTALISKKCTLSYKQLSTLSNQTGALLQQQKVLPNTLVAVIMEKGWEQVVAVLGILKAGAAYLPVDPDTPAKKVMYLLNDGDVKVVLTQSHLRKKYNPPQHIEFILLDEHQFQDEKTTQIKLYHNPDELAYVIYTSGSTGHPKGVMTTHKAVVNTVLDINRRFNVGHDDRIMALSRLNFDLSVYDIFGTLAAGATIVMPESSGIKDPSHWSLLVEKFGVTIWNSVPMLMKMFAEDLSFNKSSILEKLRLVLLSGDWIPLGLPDKLRALSHNDLQIISLGGATEASIWSISYPVTRIKPEWKSIPYGFPLTNQQFYVLNKNMELCPDRVKGDLYIGGTGLARGYWKDEEKTAGSFFIHPRWGVRLYRTGDLGRYHPDGSIEFLGRDDFQVKINGYRIETGEIEFAIKQHNGIKAAIVNPVGKNMDGKYLVGYVVAGNPGQLSSEDLKAFLKKRISDYMIPEIFMFLDELPLSSNGKIDRKGLPLPRAEASMKKNHIPPGNEMEEKIARIVGQIIKVNDISIHDRFFTLGANSLDMVKVKNQIEKIFNKEISIINVFENSSVFDLSRFMEKQLTHASSIPRGMDRASTRKAAVKRRKRLQKHV